MKRIQTIFTVALAAMLLTAGSALAAPKIGFVNLQRIVAESETGKAAMADFQKEVEKVRGEIEGEQKELESLQEEIQKKAVVMKEEERRKLVNEFEDKQIRFKRKVEETQVDLQARNQELVTQLLQKIQKVITQVGNDGGYTGILDSGTAQVLYSAPSDDLTAQVIQAFDAAK